MNEFSSMKDYLDDHSNLDGGSSWKQCHYVPSFLVGRGEVGHDIPLSRLGYRSGEYSGSDQF